MVSELILADRASAFELTILNVLYFFTFFFLLHTFLRAEVVLKFTKGQFCECVHVEPRACISCYGWHFKHSHYLTCGVKVHDTVWLIRVSNVPCLC